MCLLGGWNNNPNCQQFKYIMRRLQVRCGVKPGSTGNVQVESSNLLSLEAPVLPQEPAPSPFEDSIIDHTYCQCIMKLHIITVENIVVYMAGWVIRKIMKRLTCNTCRESLVTDHVPPGHGEQGYSLLKLRNRGGLLVPSRGTVSLLMASEKAIRRCMNIHSAKNICTKQQILYQVKCEYGTLDPLSLGDHIHETQHGIDNHYYSLMGLLVEIYYTVRQHHIAKCYSMKKQGQSVRQKLNKVVLFKGD